MARWVTRRPPLLLLAGLAITLVLSGCVGDPTSAGGETPRFTGPYAAEIEQAWHESESEFVRAVIADEKVSDQEWAELSTRMTECLAASGLDFRGFDDFGRYSVGPSHLQGESLSEVVDACEISSGEIWVHPLRLAMRQNPQNEPIEDLMAQCLVRNGAVAADYTGEQFDRDNPTRSFPFLSSEKESIFWACNEDPLHTDQRR